jgi:hypothetical protein
MARELEEELNIKAGPSKLQSVGEFVVCVEDASFEYFAFVLPLERRPLIKPNSREIHRVEWKPIGRIQKRKVVPYFYNTINALVEWETNKCTQISMFPELEATRVDRNRLRSFRASRILSPASSPSNTRRAYTGFGPDSIWQDHCN